MTYIYVIMGRSGQPVAAFRRKWHAQAFINRWSPTNPPLMEVRRFEDNLSTAVGQRIFTYSIETFMGDEAVSGTNSAGPGGPTEEQRATLGNWTGGVR